MQGYTPQRRFLYGGQPRRTFLGLDDMADMAVQDAAADGAPTPIQTTTPSAPPTPTVEPERSASD